ncbi:alpha/beta hydrolase [Streptomyces sp. NPDC052225]|uniref:alpha/beta fold hydrolase n=1 Tax=Streptomyces sp. NPDC052225 TaxID=3154949 RepID=UPI00342B8CE8
MDGGAITVRGQAGDRGATPVLVHYWGGSARTWDGVVARLPSHRGGVRYDQRGWSGSRDLPGPYGLRHLADDLLRVVSALELDDYVLVGHSMGGKVAQLAAAQAPSGLSGLLLVAPAPPRPPATVTAAHQRALAHAYDSAEAVEQALDHVLTSTAVRGAARRAVLADSLAAHDPARREWPLHGIAEDITADVTAIEVPVLVLAGEHDRVEPAAVLREHLLPHVRHARLQVVPGSGHLLPLEAPAAVAAAVEAFTADRAGVRPA